ncbi:hypothetical protein L218DRAFT_498820 [Marasmius fiardii PR-910]|nr:hypothetical protein L218DRAFT_498820 [Marasmius fiardii PR-910]
MSLSHLERLPVELLYEIQLYALSEYLPYTSKRLYIVYESTPTLLRAQYVYHRTSSPPKTSTELTNAILRYPICTTGVFQYIVTHLFPNDNLNTTVKQPELPRRLFRTLTTKKPPAKWRDTDHPLPFLEFLYDSEKSKIPPPDPNSHYGYALTKAVHAGFVQLVRFLLSRGATPVNDKKNGLTVMIAIRQKNLGMVKMLVERGERDNEGLGVEKGKRGGNKRRKMEDRFRVTPEMLQTAVRCRASDIIEYFTKEKGIRFSC